MLGGVSAAGAAKPSPSARVHTIDTQTQRALLDLYALDSRLHAAQAHLNALQSHAAQLHAAQLQLGQELDATQRTLSVSQHALGDNLSMLYKQGDVSALAVVLGSQSLDDAMTRLDDLNRVADESRQVVEATTSATAKLESLRRTYQEQSDALNAALAEARATTAALDGARSDRVAFIGRLRTERRLETAKIEAAARQVEAKAATLQAAAATQTTPETTPAPPPSVGARTITVTATGYVLPGRTATGMPVGPGVVAVDPAVIPLGTRLSIPGYGEGVAADTGGAVRGNTIDLWFSTLAQAHAWGRRTVTITLH